MGYLSTIDEKETIRRAKEELNDFADLLKLIAPVKFPGVRATDYNEIVSKVSFKSHDQNILDEIERKDKRMREIARVVAVINTLEQEYVELIWMKHVERKTCEKISQLLNIDKSSVSRKLKAAYYSFAIAAGIAVEKVY